MGPCCFFRRSLPIKRLPGQGDTGLCGSLICHALLSQQDHHAMWQRLGDHMSWPPLLSSRRLHKRPAKLKGRPGRSFITSYFFQGCGLYFRGIIAPTCLQFLISILFLSSFHFLFLTGDSF